MLQSGLELLFKSRLPRRAKPRLDRIRNTLLQMLRRISFPKACGLSAKELARRQSRLGEFAKPAGLQLIFHNPLTDRFRRLGEQSINSVRVPSSPSV